MDVPRRKSFRKSNQFSAAAFTSWPDLACLDCLVTISEIRLPHDFQMGTTLERFHFPRRAWQA
jgi:hypothetical protein